jgi:uncharacterized membrane protein
VRDLVTNLFRRLGMVGAIVLASALIFGAIAGGVTVHRLNTRPSASSEQGQGAEGSEKNGHESSSEAEEPEDKAA